MTKKNKQTRGSKNFPAKTRPAVSGSFVEADLIIDADKNEILFGPSGITKARPDFFEKLTTLKEHQLRNMADEGYFPAPIKRRFNITATIMGVVKCLMARADRNKGADLPTLASMDASEGAGLFSKRFLQTLKSAGCPGFPASGRIELSTLLPGIEAWLSGDNQRDKLELQREGAANWGIFREKYQGKSEKLKFEELDGRLIDSEIAFQTAQAAQTVYFTLLDRLAVDYPGRLAGRTAAEIKTEVSKSLKKVREAVAKEFEARRKKSDQQLESIRKQGELVEH